MIVAVIGNYDPPPHVYALAEGVGQELARHGVTVVCGGLTRRDGSGVQGRKVREWRAFD